MAILGWVALAVLAVNVQASERMAATSRLMNDLYARSGYSKSVPPFASDAPLDVKLQLSLIELVNADPARAELDLVAWIFLTWTEPRLAWDPSKYSNITDIRVDSKHLWIPDIELYGQTTPTEMVYPDVRLLVHHTGQVTFVPSKRFRTACDLKGVDSSSGAECLLKFGSWTYSGFDLDLNFGAGPYLDLDNFFDGGEYEVLNQSAKRNVIHYSCCPEPYIDLSYNLTIKEKGASSYFNWV